MHNMCFVHLSTLCTTCATISKACSIIHFPIYLWWLVNIFSWCSNHVLWKSMCVVCCVLYILTVCTCAQTSDLSLSVCLSICLCVLSVWLCMSICMQDNTWTLRWMWTKLGRRGQVMTLPLEVIKTFWHWSDSGCGSRITFPFSLALWDKAFYDNFSHSDQPIFTKRMMASS